jgi:hypothetical protein
VECLTHAQEIILQFESKRQSRKRIAKPLRMIGSRLNWATYVEEFAYKRIFWDSGLIRHTFDFYACLAVL